MILTVSLRFSSLNILAACFSINQEHDEALRGEHAGSVNSCMSGAGSRTTLRRYCKQTGKGWVDVQVRVLSDNGFQKAII